MNTGKVKRVAIIEPVGGHGGMNFYDYGLAQGLVAQNVDVYFFTSKSTKPLKNEYIHTIHTFSSIWQQKNKTIKCFMYLRGMWTAMKISKRKKVSLLHLHCFHLDWLFCFGVMICKLFHFKIVVTLHDITAFAGKNLPAYLERKLIYLVDEIILHNEFSLHEITQLYPHRHYNLVRHGNYIPFVKRVDPQQSKKPFKLLFFGQIKKVKGLDILLEALDIMKQQNVRCHLTIAGKVWQDSFKPYQEFIDKRELGHMVEANIRYIPDAETWHYFNNTNLVVLPYKRIYQSGVVLMAMSFGRAVLASDLPAFTEMINPNVNGFLFKAGDPQSLATAIRDIINKKLDGVEKEAFDYVSLNNDWSNIGRETLNVYDSCGGVIRRVSE